MTKLNEWKWVCVVFLMWAGTAIASHGQATYKVLYNFGPDSAPIKPSYSGIVAQGRDGNLYSSTCGTFQSAAAPWGSAFRITPTGTLTIFPFSQAAWCPQGGLTLGSDGLFYGTAVRGSHTRLGSVFQITSTGLSRRLHNFVGGRDGGAPYAPPIQGSDGNFYGTTSQAYKPLGPGTIYKITPSGEITTLHLFDGNDGALPYAPLVQGADGDFYGTARNGGSGNVGVIFKITTAGKFAVLYNFDGTHGAGPYGPLVQGSDGNFYGTAANGGTGNAGLVFTITPTGTLTVLHNMNGTTDGAFPYGGLVQATDGNFYGVNSSGGNMIVCNYGCGTIFRVSPQGTYVVLYDFDIKTGMSPFTTMIQHTKGILYGDTYSGGSFTDVCQDGCGVFFSLDVGLAPFVRLVNTTGKIGGIVQILGQGFTGTTDVSVNGTAASFRVVSDTYLTATVPSGATTGFVTVTTPSGTLTSNKIFRVKP